MDVEKDGKGSLAEEAGGVDMMDTCVRALPSSPNENINGSILWVKHNYYAIAVVAKALTGIGMMGGAVNQNEMTLARLNNHADGRKIDALVWSSDDR